VPQLPLPGQRAIFHVDKELRLQPADLGFAHLRRERRYAGGETTCSPLKVALGLQREPVLDLAGVAHVIPASEIDPFDLAPVVREAGDYKGLALAAGDLGPGITSPPGP